MLTYRIKGFVRDDFHEDEIKKVYFIEAKNFKLAVKIANKVFTHVHEICQINGEILNLD